MAIFVVWILLPYAALTFAVAISKRWNARIRTAITASTPLIALGSVAVYLNDALRPRRAQAAFVYVLVPPASLLLGVIVVAVAALRSRKR